MSFIKRKNEAFSRRSHGVTTKKCTKKCAARAKLLFCSLNMQVQNLDSDHLIYILTRQWFPLFSLYLNESIHLGENGELFF